MWIFYRLKRIIKDVYWSIIYAFQRVYKGYDNRDVFSFNTMFTERMVKILEEFKRAGIVHWWKPNPKDENDYYSEEETETLIDTMLWYFKMSDEYFVYVLKYGDNAKYDFEKYKQCRTIAYQNQQQALKLFVIFFNDLWI